MFLFWSFQCYQADRITGRVSGRVAVEIMDVNDNPAVFDPIIYTVQMREHSDGFVATVTATDADEVI